MFTRVHTFKFQNKLAKSSMLETIRESTTITLPVAGHMMMVEQPEQTLDALISFFEN